MSDSVEVEKSTLDLLNKQNKYIDMVINNQKTLRDEFAMAALNAISNMEDTSIETFEEIAICSYKLADAMLEARKAKGE